MPDIRWRSVAPRLWNAALDAVFPRFCCQCGEPVGADGGLRYLCWSCFSMLRPVSRPYCEICGDPVEGFVEESYTCDFCRRAPPSFNSARSAVRYSGAAQIMLKSLKYRGAMHLTPDAVTLLEGCARAHFDNNGFDAVTSVPLYPRRRRERGFNQSDLLAARLARRLRLPFAHLTRRIRDTPSQTALGMSARRRNVERAFAARNPTWIRERRLLLVDDVMTTGATVSEIARALLDAGAAEVHVVTVARG